MNFHRELGLTAEEYASVPPDRMIDIAYAVFGEEAKNRVAWAAFEAWANGTKEEYDYWGSVFMRLSN